MFRYIRGFAESRSEIERKLGDNTDVIIEHLMRLYLSPTSHYRDHWMEEIAAFIHDVKKLKSNNRYPSAKQIYQWTYDKTRDRVTELNWFVNLMEDIAYLEKLEIGSNFHGRVEEFDEICESYFRWLAANLSSYGRVSTLQVKNKLSEFF